MKILITLSYYLPNISGLTVYSRNLAEGLVKNGRSVEILTSRHVKNLLRREEINGVSVKRVWTPFILGRGPIMPTYLINAYKSVKRVDIVDVHLPQFEGFVTSIISKILGKKLIITYHCDLSFWKGFLNMISTFAVYKSNFISCSLADKIIVNSKDYADTSWFLRLFKKKLVYIYPPVRVGEARVGVLKDYKSIEYKIGYVGRISKEKGVGYLLASIKYLKEKLPSFKIFLVGPKDDIIGGSQESEIKILLEKYKDNIILLGKLNEEELWGFYKEIDILVLPSVERQESFGMVQIEAMLSDCPVVAADLPGVRVPIRITHMGEIVETKNPEKLGEAVIKDLKIKKKNLDEYSKKLVLFSCDKAIKEYEEVFKSLSL